MTIRLLPFFHAKTYIYNLALRLAPGMTARCPSRCPPREGILMQLWWIVSTLQQVVAKLAVKELLFH